MFVFSCSIFVTGMIYWRPGCCVRVFVMGMIYWGTGCCVCVFVTGMIYWRPGCCAHVFLQCFCDGYDLLEAGMLCLCFPAAFL